MEQIIRPTGLIDPVIEIRPAKGQVDSLLGEVRAEITKGNRILVTTLTKRMAEDLTEYYHDLGVKVRIFTRTSRRWSERKLSAISGEACSMCWWELTCCARDWIFPK